jgi:hypothetical protein
VAAILRYRCDSQSVVASFGSGLFLGEIEAYLSCPPYTGMMFEDLVVNLACSCLCGFQVKPIIEAEVGHIRKLLLRIA